MSLPKNTSDILKSRGYEPLADFACFEGRNGIVLRWSHQDAEPTKQQINDWAVIFDAMSLCRSALDAAISAARSATIPYTLPAGSKLNNLDAAGTQVNLPAVHPIEDDKYWPNVALSMELKAKTGTMGATERFGAVEGRIDIPAGDVMPLLTMLLPKLSGSLTNRLDIEDQFEKATTAEEYDAIRLAIQG